MQSEWRLTSNDGWFVETVLASEPGQFVIEVDPLGALKELRSGMSGVQWAYARDFDAPLDVFVPGAGAGALLSKSIDAEHGFVAAFHPYQRFFSPRVANWSGPGVRDSCNAIPGVSACPPIGVAGAAGHWEFHVLERLGPQRTTDDLWLVYLDERLPEPLGRASD
jgi:hypothetical protein